MAKEGRGSSVTMTPRKSVRIRRIPERYVDKSAENNSESDHETVGSRRREPVARGHGRGRGRERTSVISVRGVTQPSS